MKALADAFELEYFSINSNEEINNVLDVIMKDKKPAICEVVGSEYFDEIPKSKTIVNKDGTFSSSKLEYLYPFLDEDEHCQNMI